MCTNDKITCVLLSGVMLKLGPRINDLMQRYLKLLLVKNISALIAKLLRIILCCEAFLSDYKDISEVVNPSSFFSLC